jgi:hypothetical protein
MQGSEIAPRRAQNRQRFARDIFTTKNAKATKDSEINDYKLRTTVLKSFRSSRKFSVARGYSKRGFARAKTPSTPSPEV